MAKRLGWYRPEQLVLKITLSGSQPKIWRRVDVHSGLTLHDLHFVIQNAFSWNNSHLYHFLVSPGGKQTRSAMRDAIRYHVMPPDPIFGDDNKDDRRVDEAMIGRIFTEDCQQIVYEYDFGDGWQHLIKLEKRTQGGDQDHIPVCLAGENAAPFDDMGGIPGYYMYLDALANESDEAHKDAIEWLGKDFDLTRFDIEEANWRLKKAFTPAPRKPRKTRK